MNMRMTEWAKKFGLTIVRAEDRPDQDQWTAEQKRNPRRLIDVFTTRDGSWDVSDKPGSIEQWARNAYLYPPNHPRYNQQGGADHNLFGLLLDVDGAHLPGAGFWYWSDGFGKELDKIITRIDAEPSGWANLTMYSNSAYNLDNNHGPWCWSTAYGDVVVGGGMPERWHVSMFGVWQIQPGATFPPPIEPPPPSGDATLTNILAYVQRIDANLESLMLHLGALGR